MFIIKVLRSGINTDCFIAALHNENQAFNGTWLFKSGRIGGISYYKSNRNLWEYNSFRYCIQHIYEKFPNTKKMRKSELSDGNDLAGFIIE